MSAAASCGGVRAAEMLGPGQLRLATFPMPSPEPGAAVLEVHYSGICGTDRHTWRGESLQYAGTAHQRHAAYPLVCGHENVGVLAALGPGEPPLDEEGRPLRVGDRVVPAPNLVCGRCRYCRGGHPYYLCTGLRDYGNALSSARPPHLFGGWAEHMYLLPGTRLFRVPEALPSSLAALAEPFAVTGGLDAARLLTGQHGGFGFGDAVAVLGAGPLGLLHLAKAELLGAGRLFAVDLQPARLALARRFGAELALDAAALDRQARLEALRDATGGLGPDVVVCCSGVAETLAEAVELVRPGGTVIEAGAFVGAGTVPLDPNVVCAKGIVLFGVGGEVLEQYAPALRMLARHRGRLPFDQLVTDRVGLDEVAAALRRGAAGGAVKVLVAPNGTEGDG